MYLFSIFISFHVHASSVTNKTHSVVNTKQTQKKRAKHLKLIPNLLPKYKFKAIKFRQNLRQGHGMQMLAQKKLSKYFCKTNRKKVSDFGKQTCA